MACLALYSKTHMQLIFRSPLNIIQSTWLNWILLCFKYFLYVSIFPNFQMLIFAIQRALPPFPKYWKGTLSSLTETKFKICIEGYIFEKNFTTEKLCDQNCCCCKKKIDVGLKLWKMYRIMSRSVVTGRCFVTSMLGLPTLIWVVVGLELVVPSAGTG